MLDNSFSYYIVCWRSRWWE